MNILRKGELSMFKNVKSKKLTITFLIYLSIVLTDFGLVRNGDDPMFSPFTTLSNPSEVDSTRLRIGLLYYFSEIISISPTQPLSHSPEVRMGIWFTKGIMIYSSHND